MNSLILDALQASVILAITANAESTVFERVSVSTEGIQGNGASVANSVSSTGRFVSFGSVANNLVSADTNGRPDIFIRDRQIGVTTRISVSSSGAQANDGSFVSSLSADGRYVAFRSLASNLVSNDTNAVADAFLHDRQNGQTIRVNVSSQGAQAVVAPGDDAARDIVVTRGGTHVMFTSQAANLVMNDTNAVADVFLYRISDGQVSRVSTASNGAQGNGSSGNGGFLIFGGRHSDITADGSRAVFVSNASNFYSGDTNQTFDLFLKDTISGQLTLLEVQPNGLPLANPGAQNPRISNDGQWVTFRSSSNGLVSGDNNNRADVFVRRLPSGPTTMVNLNYFGALAQSLVGSGGSGGLLEPPSISGAGRFVSYQWSARDIVPGTPSEEPRIFIRDVASNRSYLVAQRNVGDTRSFALNATLQEDAMGLLFNSIAEYFVPGDTNDVDDVFYAALPERTLRLFFDGFDLPKIGGQVRLGIGTGSIAAGSNVGFSWNSTYVPQTGTPCRPFAGPPNWLAIGNLSAIGSGNFQAPASAGTYPLVFSCTDEQGESIFAEGSIQVF